MFTNCVNMGNAKNVRDFEVFTLFVNEPQPRPFPGRRSGGNPGLRQCPQSLIMQREKAAPLSRRIRVEVDYFSFVTLLRVRHRLLKCHEKISGR